MTKLPEAFLEKVRELLPDEEYQAFLDSYKESPYKGVRANTLKINREDLVNRLPGSFNAEEISWTPDGLYIDAEARPGKQPEYYSGLYYPQEPSAMSSAQALEVEPGEMVLDLCAAPGGKSTQLAAKLGNSGTLVLNEIVKGRVGTLMENIERMGITNAVILNENPKKLEKTFRESFDKILVDAPCSGEGMFRKDERVIEEWDSERPAACSRTQRKILESVDVLLKPGGELVYSTCTFSPEENEEIISHLNRDLGYEILDLNLKGIETGGDISTTDNPEVLKAVRIWPHKNRGEGHFVARLRKPESEIQTVSRFKANKNLVPAGKKKLKEFYSFLKEYLPDYEIDSSRLYTYKDLLYLLPDGIRPGQLAGLRVKRPGFLLGEIKKNRFEPSHALAMSLNSRDFNNSYELGEEELWRYLKGEEIRPGENPPRKGWVLMCYEGYPVGFSKMSTALKNKYPKGLRIYKKV